MSLLEIIADKAISRNTLDLMGICYVSKGSVTGQLGPEFTHRLSDWGDERLVYPLRDLWSSFRGLAYRTTQLKFMYDTAYATRPTSMLYGLNVAHTCIAESGYAIIVEGIFDFLKLYDNGVKNVVSSLGTNLSWDQACLLRRFTTTAVVVYDPDTAGREAAAAARIRLGRAGIAATTLDLGTLDPDDFVAAHGEEKFKNLCSQSLKNTESSALMYP